MAGNSDSSIAASTNNAEYQQGDISLDEAIFKGICATRQLAKRQITWLRGWQSEITWLDSLEPEKAKQIVLEKWAKFSA